MTQQDIARVKQIIQSVDPTHAENVLQKLPILRTGEFLMLSPDVYDDVVNFQVRWLVTEHKTLDEQDIPESIAPETLKFFKKFQTVTPEKKTKPVKQAPKPPVPQKPLTERIQLLLNSARQSVSADYVAENLNVPIEDAEKALNTLVRAKIVKKSKEKGDEEYLYWLAKFGFEPSKNVLGEVLAIRERITQVESFKRAKSWLEGGFFSKNEQFYDATFSHLSLIHISEPTRPY